MDPGDCVWLRGGHDQHLRDVHGDPITFRITDADHLPGRGTWYHLHTPHPVAQEIFGGWHTGLSLIPSPVIEPTGVSRSPGTPRGPRSAPRCPSPGSDPMPYGAHLTPARLLTLASNTASALGPEWSATGLLSAATLAHPLGLRVQLHLHADALHISAQAAMSSAPGRPAEITVTAPATQVDSGSAAELIHSQVLPHLGHRDAHAALRLLSLPLRSAGIPAIAQWQRDSVGIALRKNNDGEPVISVHVLTPYDGHVALLLDHLSVGRAIRCAQAALLEAPATTAEQEPFAGAVQAVLDAIPDLRAAPSLAGPRFTILRRPDAHVTVRHDANAADPAAPMALFLPKATIATAYAVLRTYAA
ncbi:hypothetical protein ACO0M4_11930 [Streptomyces sp. RGM 3693]|uniref:hypothetical protein n=1 Tax=Streptomyces sp. RGM 3693 TaxID=3413284 RepID=UPI003D2AD59F